MLVAGRAGKRARAKYAVRYDPALLDTVADVKRPSNCSQAGSGASHIAQAACLETQLYRPVKAFLEERGFSAKGEVCGCDIVAVRPGEPPIVIITELKLSFTLELVLQAVDRMRAADQVYLAVAGSRRGRDQDGRVHRLCRLLGLGLLIVDTRRNMASVMVEPMPYRPRPDLPRRKRLLTEHGRRTGDPALGGSTRRPIMTAYRQRALRCAMAMAGEPKRPRDLRPLADDAGAILRRNVYGWFERVCPGLYRLTPAGTAAVRQPTQTAESAIPAC